MNAGLQLNQTQKTVITQKQLQSLSILQMNGQELERFLQNEHLENPMLEYTGSSGMNGTLWNASEQFDSLDRIAGAQDSLRELLRSQIDFRRMSKEEVRVTEYLIDAVDDSGYFTQSPEEAAALCKSSLPLVKKCLKRCKTLEPAGVFSKDLAESLLRQAQVSGIADDVLKNMITHHLADIAEGNIGNISRALKISTAQVRKNILLISSLSPRPADGYSTDKTSFVIPDIIVTFDADGIGIILADNWFEDYRVSDYYLKLMKETHDAELKQYFTERYRRVLSIMDHINQRRETLIGLTRLLVERQDAYLCHGGQLVPFTMSEAAEELHVHVSTVSRAVREKYIQFPGKTIAMKAMFSASAVKSAVKDGGSVNAGEIKNRIRQIIEAEDKTHPLSDQAIASVLADDGVRISRRAVAKYREEMFIKGSFQRRV